VVAAVLVAVLFALSVSGNEPTPEQIGQLLIFLVASLLVSVVAHTFIRSWSGASVAATGAFAVLMQGVRYFTGGHFNLDSTFAVICGFCIFFGFAVASAVGLVFDSVRRRRAATREA
jgi:carbon starvation protein CstA